MPVGRAALSPLSWIKMAVDMFRMPTVDYMGLTLDSRAVLGFNLSFFEEETELIGSYFESIDGWIREGKIAMPKTELFGMGEVGKAHERLQSGASEGKMVIEVGR
jgi:NADPH-dependent curcumin reductase CurA